MLIAVGFTNGLVSPFQVIPLIWYVLFLAIFAIFSIFVPYTDGAIKNDLWNFEHDMPESKLAMKKEV